MNKNFPSQTKLSHRNKKSSLVSEGRLWTSPTELFSPKYLWCDLKLANFEAKLIVLEKFLDGM